MHFLILVAFLATAHARAVNISNTWVLPEEGFPVFYRYFRDRISWYEADAVCQFHHANLVTVDTTAQYDAVRAYLKELDISSAVWVGLIRSNPEGEFTWTDYRGLSGDGYWSSAPDPRIAPLCAAADPTADYRWAARACGGPTVAAFICELPVPQWALGKEGCMVRALPALTILYLPESAAVQLTADCGLAGVKRIQCTGNVKREELLRDLSCADEEELLTASNNISMNSTTTEITTVSENQESTTVIITEGNTNVEVEIDNNNNSTPSMISVTSDLKEDIGKLTTSELQSTLEPMLHTDNKIVTEKKIKSNDMQNNNLKSNDIPNLVNNDHFLTNYRIQKIEDEENMQHKKLHDELARLGNFETIFTQPTDHFVPPLVIAKSKLSDDMTVLSLEEKHAQYFGAHNALKHSNERNAAEDINKKSLISTEQPNEIFIVTALTTEQTIALKDTLKNKSILPKKYIQSDFELKSSNVSKSKTKKLNKQNVIKEIVNQSNLFLEETPSKVTGVTSTTGNTNDFDEMHNDAVIDLTVTLRETGDKEVQNNITDFGKFDKNMTIEYVQTTENLNTSELVLQSSTYEPTNIYNRLLEFVTNNVTVTDNSTHFNDTSTVPDITTKMPLFKDELNNTLTTNAIYSDLHVETYNKSVDLTTETLRPEVSSVIITEIQYPISNSTISPTTSVIVQNDNKITQSTPLITSPSPTETASVITFSSNKSDVIDDESLSTVNPIVNEATNITENMEAIDNDSGDLESIDDFQSPLLSAANEPLQRPNRSRRPKQSLNRINKFNPFRILG